MNIHVTSETKKRYPNIEFRGKPRYRKNRTLIVAINHITNMRFYYSFEEDFFWLTNCEIPDWIIKK